MSEREMRSRTVLTNPSFFHLFCDPIPTAVRMNASIGRSYCAAIRSGVDTFSTMASSILLAT